jgi:hypothetical protein
MLPRPGTWASSPAWRNVRPLLLLKGFVVSLPLTRHRGRGRLQPPSVPPFPGGQKPQLSASLPVANFVQSGCTLLLCVIGVMRREHCRSDPSRMSHQKIQFFHIFSYIITLGESLDPNNLRFSHIAFCSRSCDSYFSRFIVVWF